MDALFVDPAAEPVDPESIAPFQTEHDWAKGILLPIWDEASLDSPIDRAMYDALLVKRNRAWAAWLDTRLETPGTVMVAVGAGHFAGPGSVQEMLAERDLVLERVQ